mmetsp:Transcript_11687/g.32676  ORF Transcript_11687/g.32676 Transcript_11687/m.32676 type:complete len:438 (-) Transcript_11687:1-1314(-)
MRWQHRPARASGAKEGGQVQLLLRRDLELGPVRGGVRDVPLLRGRLLGPGAAGALGLRRRRGVPAAEAAGLAVLRPPRCAAAASCDAAAGVAFGRRNRRGRPATLEGRLAAGPMEAPAAAAWQRWLLRRPRRQRGAACGACNRRQLRWPRGRTRRGASERALHAGPAAGGAGGRAQHVQRDVPSPRVLKLRVRLLVAHLASLQSRHELRFLALHELHLRLQVPVLLVLPRQPLLQQALAEASPAVLRPRPALQRRHLRTAHALVALLRLQLGQALLLLGEPLARFPLLAHHVRQRGLLLLDPPLPLRYHVLLVGPLPEVLQLGVLPLGQAPGLLGLVRLPLLRVAAPRLHELQRLLLGLPGLLPGLLLLRAQQPDSVRQQDRVLLGPLARGGGGAPREAQVAGDGPAPREAVGRSHGAAPRAAPGRLGRRARARGKA